MKQLLFLIFLLPLFAFQVSAQVVNNGPGTFVWVDTPPTHNPGASGAKFAVDKNTYIWYEWTGIGWLASGDRIQTIPNCVPPAYVPGKNNSTIVINRCDSLYRYRNGAWRHINPGSTQSVASVADSAAFRAYRGAADVVIMRDTARGGEFAKCVPCIADNYMVFTDGNGNRWRRINYDRILESWWGKWGHTSLQRAINYVSQNKVGTVGVLTHNQDITLKDSVNVWDGVRIHGFSPPLVPGTHPLDAPAKNVITLDLNNANKGAIVWDDNGRGYSDATLIENVGIVAVSPCRAALVIKKPNGGNISDILISGGGEVIADRKITNAIEVSGTVYTNWNNINIIGARTGIKELPTIFSGGTLTITGVSSVRRCVTAIDMAAFGGILANGLFLENIDTVGIRTNSLFWSGAYTENVPMAANGTVIQTINSDALINVQNVKFNGGADCITGDCAVFDGAARHVILVNNNYFNVNKIVRSPRLPQSGVIRGGSHYNVTTWTQNLFGNFRWSCGEISQYSGGRADSIVNWYTGKHRFMALMDRNNSTGLTNQLLSANGDETMTWVDPPSSIPPGTTGQVLRYDSPTTVAGESNLFWDATSIRFGIGTTSPTRRLTVQDPANAYLQVRGENNGGIELYVSNASPNAAWDSYASRGNLTTPTATNAGNTLGQFRFFGHTGSAYRQAANISIVNTVNSSVGNGVPTDMIFGVTRSGFGGATNRLWLKNRGYFSVGTDTPSGYLTVKSDDSGVPNVRLISSTNDSTGIYVRSTTPEAAQAAPPGSLSVLTDGSLFSKRTGTGNTDWGKFFNLSDPILATTTPATTGQIPKWNGTAWVAANDSIGGGGGSYTAGTGINITGTTISNTGDLSNTNEAQTLTAGTNTLTLSQVSGVGGGTVTVDTDPGNDITGGGTSGRIPVFTGTQTVANGNARFGGDTLISHFPTNIRLGVGLRYGSFGPEMTSIGFDALNFISGGVRVFDATSTQVNFRQNAQFINTTPRFTMFDTDDNKYWRMESAAGTLFLQSFTGAYNNRVVITESGRMAVGTTTPSASAQLDVQSTTGGLLPPRMTTTQRDAIASPADGLTLYNNTVSDLQLRAAGIWTDVQLSLKATATLDFPSTANNTNSDLTVTVTGAAVGDAVSVAPGLAAISNHSCYTAWVSATNTVTVRFNHYGTGGATDPASASFNIIVHKF